MKKMKKLKKADCEVLPLVLKGKWFDMIKSGEKLEEYRTSKKVCGMVERWWGRTVIYQKTPVVVFYHGYSKGRDSVAMLCSRSNSAPFWTETCIRLQWGEPGCPHIVIPLVERVELED